MIITTIAGNGSFGYSGDGGPAKLAVFGGGTNSVSVDATGNVYIDDINNSRVRKINTAGIISTYAGTGYYVGPVGDGGPATNAALYASYCAAIDGSGNLYITDEGVYRVRKVDPLTNIITTIAGDGTIGYTGDGGPATNAHFDGIFYVATDVAGNIYLSTALSVRKINSAGIITTIAGSKTLIGYSGDGGPATAALFSSIWGIAADAAGNVYIADDNRIRKVNTVGIVTTIAGSSYGSYGGDGGPASAALLDQPYGLAVDPSGNLYIADDANGRIRMIGTNDTITTIAGSGSYVFSGDGGPATAAGIDADGITLDAMGNIYICDGERVRKIFKNHAPYFKGGASQGITVCENSGADSINTPLAVVDSDFGQTLSWSTFTAPKHGTVVSACSLPSMGGALVTPMGLSYTPAAGYSGTDSFEIRVTDSLAWDTITIYVTVNPVSAISGPTSLCMGNTYTLSDAPTGGTWQSNNTAIATVGAGTGSVGTVAPGIAAITYTTTFGCTAATTVTVSPAALPITGVTSVCSGATTTLTDAGGGAWSSSNTSMATVVSTGVVTGISTGTATITYQLPTGCAATAKVIVATAPAGITGATHVCTGSTTLLSDATTGGSWSSSATTIATIGAGGLVTCVAPGTATITYGSGTGCVTTTTFTVTPGPTTISGAATVCRGNTTLLSDGVGGGTWSAVSGGAASVGSTGIVTGVSVGTATITYSLGAGCTAITTITVDPLSPVTGGASVCVGAATSLSDAVSGGLWTSSATSVATISTGGILTGAAAGSATITYTLLTGCSTTVTAIVDSLPGPINGITAICKGTMTTLSDGGTGVWSSPGYAGIVAIGSGSGIVTGIAAGTAKITYSLGTSCAVTATMTINPVAGSILGTPDVCVGSATMWTDGTGTWSSSDPTVTVGMSTGIIGGVSAGTASITYTPASGCSTNKAMTVNPLPSAITGSSNVCIGTVTALSDGGGGTWSKTGSSLTVGMTTGIVSGLSIGTATITYTLPAGCTATTLMAVNAPPSKITGPANICGTLTVTLSDSTTGGNWSSTNTATVSVNATTAAVTGVSAGLAIITYTTGAGCTATKMVTVNPAAPPITGVANMCAGEKMQVYDADTTYGSWTSTLVTITSGGLVNAYLTGPAMITYTLPTGCFAAVSLTVNPSPAAITGSNIVCTGNTTMLNDSVTGGVWNATGGNVTVSGTGVVSGITAGTAVITYSLAGCGVTDTMTVYPSPSAITGGGNVCIGATMTLSDALIGGTWSAPGGIATVGASTGIVTGISAGTVLVTYITTGGCMTDKTVSVLPLPDIYGISGGGSFCAGDTGVHVLLSGSAGGVQYRLYDGGLVTDSLTRTGGLLDFGLQTAAGIYKATGTDTITGCSNTMADSATVIINPLIAPSVVISSVPGDTVCAGTAVTYTATPVNGGGGPTYQWRVNGADVGASGTAYTYTPINGDAVIVMMTSNVPCTTPVLTDTFVYMSVITPVTPVVTITADPGINIAKGQSVTFTANVTNGVPDVMYQWLLNGTDLAGETNATYISNSLANSDNVSCMVTTSVDLPTGAGIVCSASGSGSVQMNVNSTGVKPLTPEGELTIWPNPVKDELIISNAANSEVRIYDLLGQEVFSIGVVSDKEVLHVRDLVPGVYVVHILGNDGLVVNVRLVKE